MRFLISPNPQCDLIIGARSIQKDKLLAVPNLMDEGATTGVRIDRGRLYVKFGPEPGKSTCSCFELKLTRDLDPKRTDLYNAWWDASEKVVKLDAQMTEAQRKNLTGQILRLEKRLVKPQEDLWIAVLELEIYDWGHGKDRLSSKPADRNKKIEENYKFLDAIAGYNREDSYLHKITGSKWKQE